MPVSVESRIHTVEEFYDVLERRCVESIELSPNGPVVALNIPIGQWHTVRVLESGTVILEVKDGSYEPLTDVDVLKVFDEEDS